MSDVENDILKAMRTFADRAGGGDDVVAWLVSPATANQLAAAAGVPATAAGLTSVWATPIKIREQMPRGIVLPVTRAQREDELLARLHRAERAERAEHGAEAAEAEAAAAARSATAATRPPLHRRILTIARRALRVTPKKETPRG